MEPLSPFPLEITKCELEHLLATLPTRSFKVLFHIGGLETPQQEYPSHEGPLLSASECPREWQQIARLKEDTLWQITSEGSQKIQLVDMRRKNWSQLEKWGLAQGLLETQRWWWTPCATSEEGEIQYCWSQNPEEDMDPEIEGVLPEEKEKAVPSVALQTFWSQRIPKVKKERTPWHSIDALVSALVENAQRILPPNHPNSLDGLFWNDTLDVYNLSAPRAGLLPNRTRLKITQN